MQRWSILGVVCRVPIRPSFNSKYNHRLQMNQARQEVLPSLDRPSLATSNGDLLSILSSRLRAMVRETVDKTPMPL